MTELITSDNEPGTQEFTGQERDIFRFIANMMIPAEGELPTAADPEIFKGILGRLTENMIAAGQIVAGVNSISHQNFGIEFKSLNQLDAENVINDFRATQEELVKFLQICVVSCYYKNPRVMKSLGLEPRSPHPGGYLVEPTDWSLLEPVRQMDKIYRKA